MTPQRTAILWALVAIYSAGVGGKAWSDLTARYTVDGLHRDYASPYEVPDGEVIDPRRGRLSVELARRYGEGAVSTEDVTGVFPDRGPGEGRAPRLVRVGERTLLVVGFYAHRPVVYDERHGVVLFERGAIPADAPAKAFPELREPPW